MGEVMRDMMSKISPPRPVKEIGMDYLVCKDCAWWKLVGKWWMCQNIDSPLYQHKFINHEDVAEQVFCIHWEDGYRPKHEESSE